MRRGRIVVVLASAVAVWGALLAGAANAGAASAASSWGRAIEVPGLATLNARGRAEVSSVSCGPAGNCVAGGSYWDRRRNLQGFLVSEQNGTWSKAIKVPGLTALNVGGYAEVLSVSCGPTGNCAAVGDYYDRHGQHGFVVTEQNGTWSRAIEVPGLAALSAGFAELLSVSCGPADNCAAGGYYFDRHGQQGFVVSEQNGTWSRAIEVPGLAALNAGFKGLDALAEVSSVSCGSADDCAAAGYYHDRHGHGQGFVVNEQTGTWSRAIEVPGLAALNAGGQAEVSSVSCDSAGNCAAAGYYHDRHGHGQGFVVNEQTGTWGRAIKVPGLAALNAGGQAELSSVSCSSAGNCAAGGSYVDRQSDRQGLVVSERNGTWSRAIEVPGLGSLNAGVAQVSSVSCSSAGNCAAGGYYQDRRRNLQGFVVSQT
jgi:hypothetical protein